MKRKIAIVVLLTLIVVPSFVSAALQDDLAIWREFVQFLKTDTMTLDRIHPADPRSKESRLAWLRDFVKGTDWKEWEAAPEIVRSENLVTFIITLGQSRKSPWGYIFCLIVEDGRWFYRFTEGIFIRLDRVGEFPANASDFPDLPEERKHWMRQETYWSKMIWLYNEMAGIKGKDYALNLFKDGAGYALAASTWIPFYPTPRAFILFLCWEQAKLQGNKVILERLNEHEAVIRFNYNQYFALYSNTSHLKTQISSKDYSKIFETIWQDRARAAGWTLAIDGPGWPYYLRFSR